jgi:N-acetylmuramidase
VGATVSGDCTAAVSLAGAGAPGAGLEFAGEALPLNDSDLHGAAQQLGCELAVLEAVADVESRGNGFLPDKRPKILFEAHVFSRLTGHQYDGTHPGISSRVWNRALYRGGAAEYDRIAEAIALDRAAALESASWGRFQIMGFNHAAAGFANVEFFVAAMCRSEAEHLGALVAFIRHNQAMHQALQILDWQKFAELYNGPGAVDQYTQKIQTAYARFSLPAASLV